MSRGINPKKAFDKPLKVKGHDTHISYTVNEFGEVRQFVRYTPKPRFINYQRSTYTVTSGGLFKAILFVLLVISIVGFMRGSVNVNISFTGFLRMLEGAPDIPTDWISFGSALSKVNFPFWLDWLKPFISFLASTAEVIMFFVVGIAQAITYFIYFVRFLFV